MHKKNAKCNSQIKEMQRAAREGSVESALSPAHSSFNSSTASNATSFSATNSHSIRASSVAPSGSTHPHNYCKGSLAHHQIQSALPPLLQPSNEPLRTDLVALFVDRYAVFQSIIIIIVVVSYSKLAS